MPAFFRKLLFGLHIESNEPLLSAQELLLELHRIKPNRKELGFLMQSQSVEWRKEERFSGICNVIEMCSNSLILSVGNWNLRVFSGFAGFVVGSNSEYII